MPSENVPGYRECPVVAVTDYSHLIANQLRRFIPARFAAVGSDSRVRGEIHYPQAEWIALCALKLLADEQKIPSALIADALRVLHHARCLITLWPAASHCSTRRRSVRPLLR